MNATPLQDDLLDVIRREPVTLQEAARSVRATVVCARRAAGALVRKGLIRPAGFDVCDAYRRMIYEAGSAFADDAPMPFGQEIPR